MNESIGYLIKTVNLECDKLANSLLTQFDLTHTQFKVLKLLYSNPALTVRQIDIERYFSMTNPTVTNILNNMEKKELIRRVANPTDKRSKVLVLTDKAETIREELGIWADSFDRRITANLSAQEQAQLALLLKKMLPISQKEDAK